VSWRPPGSPNPSRAKSVEGFFEGGECGVEWCSFQYCAHGAFARRIVEQSSQSVQFADQIGAQISGPRGPCLADPLHDRVVDERCHVGPVPIQRGAANAAAGGDGDVGDARPALLGQDTLRLRRWCSGTSTRWCEIRVRIDGGKGGLIESEAFWININRDTLMPSRISDDFLQQLRRTTDIHRLRWKAYLKPGARDDANQIREYPVRFTDLDLFDHMNNAVYWSVIEEYLSATPGLFKAPLRVIIEHETPVALGDKLEILAHTHPAGSTDKFGPDLVDRAVTTLTYVDSDETKIALYDFGAEFT
jgi:acyl-ACP thioesterase